MNNVTKKGALLVAGLSGAFGLFAWLERNPPPPTKPAEPPPLVVEKMLPFVTVFSNLASINILDAAPQVVAALPGMTPERLQAVLSQRGDPALDPSSLIAMAGGEGVTLAGSRAYRVTVGTELGNGRQSTAEAVILLLESGDQPYRVLSWRNASDGDTAPQRATSK